MALSRFGRPGAAAAAIARAVGEAVVLAAHGFGEAGFATAVVEDAGADGESGCGGVSEAEGLAGKSAGGAGLAIVEVRGAVAGHREPSGKRKASPKRGF